MGLLCHPWLTTTNLSYRCPVFETSTTALCGSSWYTHVKIIWFGFAMAFGRFIESKFCRPLRNSQPRAGVLADSHVASTFTQWWWRIATFLTVLQAEKCCLTFIWAGQNGFNDLQSYITTKNRFSARIIAQRCQWMGGITISQYWEFIPTQLCSESPRHCESPRRAENHDPGRSWYHMIPDNYQFEPITPTDLVLPLLQ